MKELAHIQICSGSSTKIKCTRNMAEKRKMTSKIPSDAIDLIVYDFDGVMTDNRVIVFQDGSEAIMANRSDGLGVERIRSLGIPQMILSTETNPVVKARGTKLKLEVISGCRNKKETLSSYCHENNYDLKQVVYIGNDLNDLEAMKIVGFPIAPADAHPDILKIACMVTTARGGEGVVKELSEHIKN